MNKYQERGGSKGGIAHSLTHPIPPFALPVKRPVSAERARLKPPFSNFRRVRLIFGQKFSPIKTITYVPFYGLAYFLLTLVADKPPKPAGKTDTPFPPTPGLIGRSQTHDFFPTFEGAKM